MIGRRELDVGRRYNAIRSAWGYSHDEKFSYRRVETRARLPAEPFALLKRDDPRRISLPVPYAANMRPRRTGLSRALLPRPLTGVAAACRSEAGERAVASPDNRIPRRSGRPGPATAPGTGRCRRGCARRSSTT